VKVASSIVSATCCNCWPVRPVAYRAQPGYRLRFRPPGPAGCPPLRALGSHPHARSHVPRPAQRQAHLDRLRDAGTGTGGGGGGALAQLASSASAPAASPWRPMARQEPRIIRVSVRIFSNLISLPKGPPGCIDRRRSGDVDAVTILARLLSQQCPEFSRHRPRSAIMIDVTSTSYQELTHGHQGQGIHRDRRRIGLGEGTARMLATNGGIVVIADMQADKGEAIAREIGGAFVRCDVSRKPMARPWWPRRSRWAS